jgi:hypothetical protein
MRPITEIELVILQLTERTHFGLPNSIPGISPAIYSERVGVA